MNTHSHAGFKLLVVISLLLICSWGCESADYDPEIIDVSEELSVERRSYSLTDALYHKATESWIVHQNDPYALANFQKAYNNLSKGNTQQKLTDSQNREFTGKHLLKPTHYSLKIYPKNEAEQSAIALMDDIKVSYIPFDYVQLPEEDAEKLAGATRSKSVAYGEESRYSITYEGYVNSDGTPAEPVKHEMPVMYAVWPSDKPLPEGFDYELDYEIFLPQSNEKGKSIAFSPDAEKALENEAIGLALGITPPNQTTTRAIVTLTGRYVYYDTKLKKQVPQANLMVRFALGSNIKETYTLSDGYFSITSDIPLSATHYIVFSHPHWKITRDTSTAPFSVNLGQTAADYLGATVTRDATTTVPAFEIHQAINYYFNAPTIGAWWYVDYQFRIIAYPSSGTSAFWYYPNDSSAIPYIEIRKNNKISNTTNGIVWHEFGHYHHYGYAGHNKFNIAHGFIRESFADYISWQLGEYYYGGHGYQKISAGEDVVGHYRQDWPVGHWHYSPIFTDLVDNFNQKLLLDDRYNADAITNGSYSFIMSIIMNCTDWNSVRTMILNHYTVGGWVLKSAADFVKPYDAKF